MKSLKRIKPMHTPPDWAIEIARTIFKTEHDTPELDLMELGFSADTAIGVYDALEYLHELEK
jgi:hypothetical protein